ncbi:MAG: PKD domain-containing protein [Bacteroidales bacterium]
MKSKYQNISLRELFRKKLEYAEILPDAAIKSILMRKVARKEFMHFNPDRLNIFYLGGILIAGITVAVLIFSAPKDSDQLKSSNIQEKLSKPDTLGYFKVIAVPPIRTNPANSIIIHNESTRSTKVSPIISKSKPESSEAVSSHQMNTPPPASIINSISKKRIFTGASPDNKRLQSGFKPEDVFIEPSDSAGCAPLKVHFHIKSTSFNSCKWTFGDGGFSNQKDPEWIFDVEGEYKIVLEIVDYDGKHEQLTSYVTVYPRPHAHFEITPEKSFPPNDEIRFLNYSTNAVQFNWEFGDGSVSDFFEPVHSYSKTGNYNVRLVVISDLGCSDSLTVFNALSGSQYFINFPNAFIPNTQGPSGGYYSSKSDEAALVFHPSYSGVSEYRLKIFSKLGIEIFESNDINLGWDGYNKGQLCEPGVYIWKVRGKFRNNEPFIKMGDVTLLKK